MNFQLGWSLLWVWTGAMLSNSTLATTALTAEPLIFIAYFAAGNKGGIHTFQKKPQTGILKRVHLTTGVENPFFLVVSKDQKFFYSIHAQVCDGKQQELIAAYEIEGRADKLKLLNRQSACGSADCYLDIDATGQSVFVGNDTSGSVASLPLQKDGALIEAVSFFQHVGSSINPVRQQEPHAHCIVVSSDNRCVLAADLGLDQVLVYRLDALTSKLTPNDPPFIRSAAGAGPRHQMFHSGGQRVYIINELANSVTVFDYDGEAGRLSEIQTISTVPEVLQGTSHCANLRVTPSGCFLYGTNRGHGSIAVFRIGNDDKLMLIGIAPSLGKGPQNLALLPDGETLLCANMPGHNVAMFLIDPQTGRLSPPGDPIAMTSPSCILGLPNGGADPCELEPSFESFFNGKDLTGWHYANGPEFTGQQHSSDGRYTVRDDRLVVNPGKGLAQMWTMCEFPRDFHLKLEFRTGANTDSGISLRKPQLQCRDSLVAGPYKELKNYKPQDGNEIEVIVKGNVATCTCNGEELKFPNELPPTGPIGLVADRGQIEYRRLRIKELM